MPPLRLADFIGKKWKKNIGALKIEFVRSSRLVHADFTAAAPAAPAAAPAALLCFPLRLF